MNRDIFGDFCNAASEPLSAFRREYDKAASGIVNSITQSPSIGSTLPTPSRER